MPRPEVADEYLDLLRKSRVLPTSQIQEALDRFDLPDDASSKEMAKAFVKESLLTSFQAEELLNGRARNLFIDGFKIIEILGFGGMGTLYVAEEPETKWQVALKVLSDHHRDQAAVRSRFQLEAEAGQKLSHPNLVHTRSITRTEDLYGEIDYVVMDLIKGVSLVELLLLQGALPWRQACDVIAQAAAGLHYAHQQGMIHRDVKPDNLLVRSNGAVKVLDFGLAMVDEDDQEFTMAMIHGQDCLGTADYVAPEQTHDSYTVDPRADIYSLGCTLYAALTAKLPFPAKTTKEKLKCHRKMNPRPIRDIYPDVPERVELIVRKMMAKNPENRFQSADEVRRYLEPLAKRQPVSFDFRTILKWRAKQAKKRDAQRQRDLATGTIPTETTSGMKGSTVQSRYFDISEIHGEDTQVQGLKIDEEKDGR